MKELKDYADEINKCSKCGLCQAVCPIYKETGNDCAVSRGKFVMLDGVLKGDLKLNKTINKYLEMCLKCGKCTDFCPSGIDVCEIFRTAKHEYLKNTLEGKLIRFLQSKAVFNNLLKIFNRKKSSAKGNILYFAGCAEKIFPNNTYAIRDILKVLNFETNEPDFDCCGVPFLASGNLERYKNAMEYNTRLLNEQNGDFILTDCTSCENALKNYPNLNKKVTNTSDFIAQQNIKFIFKEKQTITFHKPCHLKDDTFLKVILSKCENIEYREMENYDDCCGFAGQFALTNRKLSLALTKKKAKNAINTGADIILTTCPACILGIKQGLIQECEFFGKQPKVMYLSEFLSKADIIQQTA